MLIENVLGCRLKFQDVAGKNPVETRNIDIDNAKFITKGLVHLIALLRRIHDDAACIEAPWCL